MEFSEFSEFSESDKSLKHELGSLLRSRLSLVSFWHCDMAGSSPFTVMTNIFLCLNSANSVKIFRKNSNDLVKKNLGF